MSSQPKRRTPAERLKLAEARVAAVRKKAAEVEAKAAKIRAGLHQKDRKSRTRQAIVLGEWLLRDEYAATRAEIISKLTRPQDLVLFGRAPAPDAPPRQDPGDTATS